MFPKAAAYVRVSTNSNEQAHSLEFQADNECFLVHWWANPVDIDKSGLVLLFSYTQDHMPDRVLNISRKIPASARGHQQSSFAIPAAGGRVLAWRATILQRGRPLSILQSPDWMSSP